MTQHPPVDDFLSKLEQSLQDGSFVKLSLGNYTGGDAQLNRIHIRRVVIKKAEHLSFTYRYKTRDIVKNYAPEEAVRILHGLITNEWNAALLCTTEQDLNLQRNPAGKVTIKKSIASHTATAELTHDRQKKRLIQPEGRPYLHALGITDQKGIVHKNAQDKYRQIEKYVEILSGLIKIIPPEKITKIADMGCGKGYLTFALYDYLAHTLNMTPAVTGVDTRADMVDLCNKIAAESDFTHLHFVQDTIVNYDSSGVNLLIALHACDTATDEAIAKGIMAGAEIIVVAPCCHKQIRRQMHAPPQDNAISFLTRHGIFAERQAEMITDGIRALILEYFGYNTKIFEFISDAHTPKNIMIVGTKTKMERQPALLDKIKQAKASFGIEEHFLEKLLHIGSIP
jgi:SAM-dependent methyltransferase